MFDSLFEIINSTSLSMSIISFSIGYSPEFDNSDNNIVKQMKHFRQKHNLLLSSKT